MHRIFQPLAASFPTGGCAVHALWYALFSLLWNYNTYLKQLKSLTPILYSEFLFSRLIQFLEIFLCKREVLPTISSSECIKTSIQKSQLPFTAWNFYPKKVKGVASIFFFSSYLLLNTSGICFCILLHKHERFSHNWIPIILGWLGKEDRSSITHPTFITKI